MCRCQGQYSPYYNESHVELREAVREFVDEHIMPNVSEWDDKLKEIPREIYKLMGDKGFNYLSMGYPFPKEYGQPPACLAGGGSCAFQCQPE